MPLPKLADKPLPVTREELGDNTAVDFVFVTGDAYVDHPSFGIAIISRILQDKGYSVAIIPQPNYKQSYKDASGKGVCVFGKPRLGFLVSSGNIDSMVAHYTASKKRRSEDYYSPEKKAGLRPDRAVIVYCNRIREAYGDVPIIIGGLEASLRRFAHYDYWENKVRRSILIDSCADILVYGMGEKSIPEIARLLDKGVPVKKIRDVLGTVVTAPLDFTPKYPFCDTYSYDELKTDKVKYAKAFAEQYKNVDAVNGKAIVEYYDKKKLVQNPPQPLLTRQEMDYVYSLPYTRTWHPIYDKLGGISAIDEVEFSITHNRGCFGGCAFCSIAFHQGRNVVSRSIESVVAEAELISKLPRFKGYIHDVGGPTANFRYGPCKDVREGKRGVCKNRRCLAPTPCKNLIADHSEYVELLREVSRVHGVKKVFVRSGVRFDYALCDKSDEFLRELVTNHVSGQLKVAPEHISNQVLNYMGKPGAEVYEKFCNKYFSLCKKAKLEQYLVPYLMSSHPGSTMNEAVDLALYLKKKGVRPEQVQDFYPTPGTASTTMYYTGLDPFTLKPVYIPRDYNEKRMQRALLQATRPENRELVTRAIKLSGRKDAWQLLPMGARATSDRTTQKVKQGTKSPKSAKREKGSKGSKSTSNKTKGTANVKPFRKSR